MRRAPPLYLINPLATKDSAWAAMPWQVLVGQPNQSRLNALWLGTAWSIGILPYRVFMELLIPLFNFRLFLALLSVFVIPFSVLLFAYHGIFTGRLRALRLSREHASRGLILNRDQCLQLLGMGRRELVVDMNSVRL